MNDNNKPTYIEVYMQQKDVETLRRIARNEERTLSGIVLVLIAEALKARGYE